MSDDKDKKAPEEGEERTVFVPGAGAQASPAAEPAPAAETPAETAAEAPAAGAPSEPDKAAEPTAATQAFVPHQDAVGIKVGDVLNHIFEVKRFLARGGMGEVFEGCNVNTDEKVAIKVMLPALANDEKVIAMFRKEARTLTKLHHEGIVQYRVLAQEPNLHVLYIVTDYIDGTNLSHALGEVDRSPEELAGLLRRLASGLGAAHQLGAVHRDMSPDNVILADDDIHKAKIIDFGIAKDLDASSATIVGDGFAGKLNYVAPEQLGDFGREVGPWSDVYSLALVILAVAQGRNVDMSGSLVDAIDKRRKGPDVAAIPDALRPLIEAMLRPDPKERLRSMDDVLAMLDGAHIPSARTARESLPADPGLSTPDRGGGNATKWVVIAVALVALLAAAALAYSYLSDGQGPFGPADGNAAVNGSSGGEAVPDPGDPVATARAAINSVLPSVSCTWLDIGTVEGGPNGLSVAMRGVAGDREVAIDTIRSALVQAGLVNPDVRFDDVAPITQAGCSALDTFRQIRAREGGHLTTAQPRFEMAMQSGGDYAGREAATAPIDLDVSDASRDFALLAIQPSGEITTLLQNRGMFEEVLAGSRGGRPISREGNGRYRVHIDADHSGWSGVLLVSGQGPFDPGLIQPAIGARGPDWQNRFLAAAAERGWRTEMVWYESVNREAEALPEPPPPTDDKPVE